MYPKLKAKECWQPLAAAFDQQRNHHRYAPATYVVAILHWSSRIQNYKTRAFNYLAQQRIQVIQQRKTLRLSTRAALLFIVSAPFIPYQKCDNVTAL